MFREVRRKLQALDESECERILREGKICCLKVGRAYRIPKAHLFTYLCIGQQEAQSS